MSAETLTLRARLSFPGFDLDVAEELRLDGVTALFGPSGGGKSALLRAVAGFERPDAGRIALDDRVWFDGESGTHVAPHRRAVGLMFQDARLFGHLDVAGNLDYADRRARPLRAPFDREQIVGVLDLQPLLTRRVESLSGGERQRVALGRTLLTRPELLLLDEPLSALDEERKTEILPYLERLPQLGIPTLYVSHSVDEVARLAGTVLVLAGGRVQAHGPTGAVLERIDLEPITGRFEASSVVDARVIGHDPRLSLTRVEVGAETITLPMVEHLAPDDEIRLRIRARDVAVAVRRPEAISIRNVLPATVAEITPERDTAFADVFLTLRTARIRARLTRASVEDLRLAPGMAVFALIKTVSLDRG